MRIIAGERKGTSLRAPKGMDTRPTQDKVKESLFSMIQSYVPDARVLDLFAGSGALALESLSRGAQEAVLCDRDREAISCIRFNIEHLRYEQQTEVCRGDWMQTVHHLSDLQKLFDLVFLDPPYKMTEVGQCCLALADAELLSEGAMLVAEHKTGIGVDLDERFEMLKERTYGDTQIHFFLYHRENRG